MRSLGELKTLYRDWLFEAALPLWAGPGVDRVHGGFEELLDQDAQPVKVPRRSRVQGRQSFVFAHAGTMGWNGPWAEVADTGLKWLEAHCRDSTGLYVTLTTADGHIADPTVMTYDQAFAILGAAALNAHGMGPGEDYALGLLNALETHRRHPGGGFVEADNRFLSNPHMHLFEAALAWIEAGGEPRWRRLADEICTLALARFFDPVTGTLGEFFGARWSPLDGDAGLVVEPGHLFEWAWLLERWSRLGGGGGAHMAARQLFAKAAAGVDRARNVAMDEVWPDLRPRRATARLWPQTERLKAALLLGEADEARAAAESLWQYLQTPRPGLWWDKMDEGGALVNEPAPASTLYHIICAIDALQASA